MIRLDHDKRARIAAAKAEIATIMDPVKAKERKERRARDREARKRVGKREEGQRQPRERDPGFLAFLRRQPCAAGHLGGCEGPIEAAHIRMSSAKHGTRNAGMQQKPHDFHATSLCRHHHQHDQHRGSEAAFWARVGLDPFETAARLYAEYQGEGR
jgi:hypothetical protein